VLALLHEGKVPVPRPGLSAGAVVLGLHEFRPSVVFDLRRPNEVKAIDGRRTAKNLSAGPVDLAVAGFWLGDGVVCPVVRGMQ